MSAEVKKIMVEVAEAVANRAKASDQPPFTEQIDALKALTAMYAALQKHPSDDADAKTGDGFDFSKGLEPEEEPPDESSTVTPIRTRRRPG